MKKRIDLFFNTSFSFVLSITILSSFILCFTLYFTSTISSLLWVGILSNVFIAILSQLYSFSLGYARLSYNFKPLGILNTSMFILTCLFKISFTYFFGLKGLFLSGPLSLLILTVASLLLIKPKFKFIKLKLSVIKKCFKLGFPIIIISKLFIIYQSIDKWFIISFLDLQQLGLYTIIVTLLSVISILITKITALFGQYTRPYYYKTKSQKRILNASLQLCTLYLPINLILIVLAKICCFILFSVFLTEYQSSFKILDAMLLTTFFISILNIINNFFITIDNRFFPCVTLLIGCLSAVLFNIIFLMIDSTILSIALATSFSSFLMFCIQLFIIHKYFNKYPTLFKQFVILISISILSFLLIELLLPYYFDSALLTSFQLIIIKLSLYTILSVVMIKTQFSFNNSKYLRCVVREKP